MTDKKESTSGAYWKQHVISWEASAYFKDSRKQPTFWDRMSTLFRGQGMYVRMEAALKLVAPHIQDKVILDIGCASGRFAFQLMEAGAQKVIGIDVSPAAIEAAKSKASRESLCGSYGIQSDGFNPTGCYASASGSCHRTGRD